MAERLWGPAEPLCCSVGIRAYCGAAGGAGRFEVRAAASAKRVMGRREIADEASRLDRRIAEYLADLDENVNEPDGQSRQHDGRLRSTHSCHRIMPGCQLFA